MGIRNISRNEQPKKHILGLVLFTYLMFTIYLFEFGPWPWPVDNKVILYSYLIINNFSLLIFFYIGVNSKRNSRETINYKKWYLFSLIVSIVLVIPTSITRTGNIFPQITGVFDNLGNFYFETRDFRQGNSSVVEYIRILFSPFLFSLFPLTLYYWKDLKKRLKYISIFVTLIYLLISINMGINKILVDYVIILFVIFFVKYFDFSFERISIKRLFRTFVLIFILIIVSFRFLSYFQSTQISRVGDHVSEYNYRAGIKSDENSIFIRFVPEKLKVGAIQLSSYITQGYYGLSLAMKEDFTWTYGVGSSIFLMQNIEELLNIDIEERTYPYKTIKYGWDPYVVWSSIYAWLGSDLTFLGVIVFIGIIGYLLGLALKDIKANRNFLAVPTLCQLCILIFYIPANNQVMQSGEAFFSFFITIILWLISRKYKLVIRK